LTTKLRRIALF